MELTLESVFRDAPRLCDETARGESLISKTTALALFATAGGAVYGLTMGMNQSLTQALVAAVKVPLLFGVTLAICLPTLHFVGLLFGSTLRFTQTLTILLAGMALTCTLLGAFTPISLLFLVSGAGYRFLLGLHCVVFTFSGLAGLRSIHQSFDRVANLGASGGRSVLRAWTALYMLVGAQTAFVLSPFLARESTFYLLNPHRGSVFAYLLDVLFA
jgi:hypothetical protein